MLNRNIPTLSILVITSIALLVGAPPARAAEGDAEACRADCETERLQCVERCSTHSNPIECEAECRDDAETCTRQCER